MPRIETYDANIQRLSPEERGADAATRAGRYVGQYRRQEAQDVKEGGILQAQGIRERGWPFDILALEQRGEGSGSSRGGGSGGGGGGGSHGSHSLLGDHGQVSRGAAGLGNIAQRFNGTSASPHGKLASREQVNSDGSRYLWYNDGTRAIQRADGTMVTSRGGGGGGGGGRQPVPYTLEGGRIVPAGKDPMLGYNEAAAKDAEAWYLKGPYGGDANGPYRSVSTGVEPEPAPYDNGLGSRRSQEIGNWIDDTGRAIVGGLDRGVGALRDWISPPERQGDLTNPDNE